MKAILTTGIPVDRIDAFAEMAWMERRPELGLVCRAARANGGRLSSATVQSVLPGLSDTGANNVVRWCAMLGLCDRHGGLTQLGEAVADTDEAPVPEQGVYRLWLGEHPALGRRILNIERLSATRDARFDAIVPVPVEPEPGVVFASLADPNQRFIFRGFPAKHSERGCLRAATKATCRLRWSLDFDNNSDAWQLDGTMETPHGLKPVQHHAETAALDLWGLAATWGGGPLASFGRWHQKDRRLAVALSSVSEAEQDSFLKTVKLKSVEVPGKGSYSDVTLEDVPVGPAAAPDAQRWAVACFERELGRDTRYRSRADVRRLFADLTEGTPLERFSPTLPAHDELVETMGKASIPQVFWSLAAPVDLSPRPVFETDLASLQIGKSAAEEAVAPAPDVVRIPYRGGWSMGRLVASLFGGAHVQRVLLCDRYVRGAENLATLQLLVQAVRAVAPAVVFEVWTADDDADFKRIQTITGTAPRAYREMFGRNPPHDRYVLVQPTGGANFGWHLSNSPLHARAENDAAKAESPLRWKDLTGARVTAEDLEPSLRNWLTRSAR